MTSIEPLTGFNYLSTQYLRKFLDVFSKLCNQIEVVKATVNS